MNNLDLGELLTELEKRKDWRITCLVPVDGKEGSAFDRTQTVDFSKKGLGLISRSKIPVDKEITVEINLGEDEDPVFVTAKVKWVKPIRETGRYRVGMYFKDVLKGSKSHLNTYFKKVEK